MKHILAELSMSQLIAYILYWLLVLQMELATVPLLLSLCLAVCLPVRMPFCQSICLSVCDFGPPTELACVAASIVRLGYNGYSHPDQVRFLPFNRCVVVGHPISYADKRIVYIMEVYTKEQLVTRINTIQ